jgi:hypothetical protein
METWRVLGAMAIGVGGLLMVLVAMAQARDSAVRPRGRPSYRPRGRDDGVGARVARAAGIGMLLLVIMVVLTLTVLPQVVVWGVAAATWLMLLTLFLVG